MNTSLIKRVVLLLATVGWFSACDSSNNRFQTPVSPPPPPPPAGIDVTGNIFDGPVSGGSLYVFASADVNSAVESADAAQDRAAALSAAGPIVELSRDPMDGDSYALTVPGESANEALFFIFDAAGATDDGFGDEPFNLEAVIIAGDAGSALRANITSHTSVTSIQVRAGLDPDGDGTVIDATEIATNRDTANANTMAAFGTSSLGDDLFPGSEDPRTTEDLDLLNTASSELGFAVRAAATITGVSPSDVVYLFAADVADGVLDGAAHMMFALDPDQESDLDEIISANGYGSGQPGDMEASNCSAAANSLRRACEFEALDEFFIGKAICAHSDTAAEADSCLQDYIVDRDDALDGCPEITAARLDLCVATSDAIHDPAFGVAFAANFVDPLTIGDTTAANPYLPLVQGTEWVYEGTFEEDGEMITEVITITVTDRIKLIDDIRCLVVRDVVEIDGELIEDTDDWFAQDVDGNIWYCGEEAKDFEIFDGDMPAIPELVAIDGSFKAGRDGDEAGILLPVAPVVGDVFRQEVSFANAEDVIEILATDGSETVPAAMCTADCLVTRDFTPLEPGAEENKYYAPGVGKILEVDVETGNRVELISVTTAP